MPPVLSATRPSAPGGGGYERLPAPAPGEWLAWHAEPGQSYETFVASAVRFPPGARAIALQPLAGTAVLSPRCWRLIATFVSAFFGLEVRVCEPVVLDESRIGSRPAPDSQASQWYTADVLQQLLDQKPPGAGCVLGITTHDLYPHPVINFAFGEASVERGVAVCSVARFGPPFCEDRPGERQSAMLRRCCKVVAHEVGHMLGLAHCVGYRCLMNGSSTLAESERRPLHLCPVDLRKLHWATAIDIPDRRLRLEQFWRGAGWSDEADWLARRRALDLPYWRRLMSRAAQFL